VIVIRKCVPRPTPKEGIYPSPGKGLFLEAEVLVSMDEDGMKELREYTLSGKVFHISRENREVDVLRGEAEALRSYCTRADQELSRMRERLEESTRRYQVLEQELMSRRSDQYPQMLSAPPRDSFAYPSWDREITPNLAMEVMRKFAATLDLSPVYVPAKREDPAPPKKAPERFGSLEFDEDE
jgi:hypothetical protein